MKMIIILSLLLCSCATTRYIEKNSEELSKSIYATKDSLDNYRVDLADKYINEATRLVTPPKNRIKIQPIYE